VVATEEMSLTPGDQTELLGKLLEVAKTIHHIEKRGRNDLQKYNFVQAVDVVRQVRSELYDRGIIVLPGSSDAQHHEFKTGKGSAAFLTTVALHYVFTDVESGASVQIPWVGVGSDTGGDKGIYKAYTGGLKYALLSLFLIPTTDDPEGDNLTEREAVPERPAAPRIPIDRAKAILAHALRVHMATVDLEAEAGTPPELHAVLKAKLAILGVDKIGLLNVDQAETVEQFLRDEEV